MRVRSLLSVLLGLLACSSSSEVSDVNWVPVSAPELGAIVAHVGQVPIYASQVLAEAKRTGEPPRRALDDLVAMNLLAERIRREGRRPEPSTDAEVKSVLVQRLLERELEPNLRPEAVPEPVLRTLYDRAKDRFVHPRLVEVGVLRIYTGYYMKEPMREERRRAALALAAYLKDHPPGSLDEFMAVARAPAWSSRHVGYDRFLQSPDKPLSKKVGEEIVKLRSPGETTGLLEDVDGFYIARYLGERPAQNITFEETRAKLVAGYLERWQQQQFSAFTDKLMQAHKVLAYFDRLPRNEQGP